MADHGKSIASAGPDRPGATPADDAAIQRRALVASGVWGGLGILALVLLPAGTGPATFFLAVFALILLPLGLIWVAALALSASRAARRDIAELRAIVRAAPAGRRDARPAPADGRTGVPSTPVGAPAADGSASSEPSPSPRPADLPAEAATGRPVQSASGGPPPDPARGVRTPSRPPLTTFHTTRTRGPKPATPPPSGTPTGSPTRPVSPPQPATAPPAGPAARARVATGHAAGTATAAALAEEQPSLALETPETAVEPLAVGDFIRAMNFPEDERDAEGFRALRLALRDRNVARLVRAAEDLLTLLSQDGIYMDDLSPDRARPEVWRRFARGERGRAVAGLAGVHDRSCLALTAGRMKSDPVFRDAAHHFLRQFDHTFAEFEKSATDQEIVALAETRTSRAFMLVGRVAGTFD